MITTFNKENLGLLRKDIDAALKTVALKHGLANLSLGTIRFGSNEFGGKIKASTVNKPVPVKANLSEVKIGDRFKQKRTIYTITRTDNKGMFKFSVKTDTGKLYKVKPQHLAEMEKL